MTVFLWVFCFCIRVGLCGGVLIVSVVLSSLCAFCICVCLSMWRCKICAWFCDCTSTFICMFLGSCLLVFLLVPLALSRSFCVFESSSREKTQVSM
ncbi:hypothetical protein IWX49DRAFT_569808 [Phyllosticta citricarpa]|uniref:Uncharacterized protein n=1 Tax=Phyllosticta citricarpa TaxID=55181 RepID=A0ABR1LJR4_9PEZI